MLNKTMFISEIRPLLKNRQYSRKGNYWYKFVDSHICCINVQGSQWDKNNYYVNIGFAWSQQRTPSILHWFCRHRCEGRGGELNIHPQELFECVDYTLESIHKTEDIYLLLKERKAKKIGEQFWF